jgi:hypothetical protein
MLSSKLEKNFMGVVELKMSDFPRHADLALLLDLAGFWLDVMLAWVAFLSFV